MQIRCVAIEDLGSLLATFFGVCELRSVTGACILFELHHERFGGPCLFSERSHSVDERPERFAPWFVWMG